MAIGDDRRRQCAGAAADLEPAGATRRRQPLQEFRPHLPAPPAHIMFVVLARAPRVELSRLGHLLSFAMYRPKPKRPAGRTLYGNRRLGTGFSLHLAFNLA